VIERNPMSELELLAERLGALRFAQGAGGNVSVKQGDDLWVKASGVRLAEVASTDGLARVDRSVALCALAGDTAAERALFSVRPRPSLETLFHALDGRVVAHTHALGVLLAACSESPERWGLPARIVPYALPGIDLALAAADARSREPDECALLLKSHGLVVYASTAERAAALTEEIDARCRTLAGELPSFETLLASYAAAPTEPFDGGLLRRLPSRVRRAEAKGRYLFPDAPVCAMEIEVASLDDALGTCREIVATLGRTVLAVDPSGSRALAGPTARGVEFGLEVVAAHDWVEDALLARGIPRYLPDDEPSRLIDMPSERYRIELASGKRTSC